ncbi:RNK Ribonuclease, partial [Alaudala cheleensis]|nr:RNK Ribonuclease [Alaudala cheleensis]
LRSLKPPKKPQKNPKKLQKTPKPLPEPLPVPAMVSLLCCGPKMAACGLVLSAWGVVMLVRGNLRGSGGNLRGFEGNLREFGVPEGGPERIYGLYEQVSYNCFIAAGLYALLGGFSLCQTRLNKRKEYMVR